MKILNLSFSIVFFFFCQQYPKITIPVYERKINGARRYDRCSCCYFCGRIYMGKIPRHMERMHQDEPIVARTLAKKKKEERELEFDKLRILGDFNHNMKVLEDKKGELFVMRRQLNPRHYEDYLPCLFCYGFVNEKELYSHIRVCKHRTESKDEIKSV